MSSIWQRLLMPTNELHRVPHQFNAPGLVSEMQSIITRRPTRVIILWSGWYFKSRAEATRPCSKHCIVRLPSPAQNSMASFKIEGFEVCLNLQDLSTSLCMSWCSVLLLLSSGYAWRNIFVHVLRCLRGMSCKNTTIALSIWFDAGPSVKFSESGNWTYRIDSFNLRDAAAWKANMCMFGLAVAASWLGVVVFMRRLRVPAMATTSTRREARHLHIGAEGHEPRRISVWTKESSLETT